MSLRNTISKKIASLFSGKTDPKTELEQVVIDDLEDNVALSDEDTLAIEVIDGEKTLTAKSDKDVVNEMEEEVPLVNKSAERRKANAILEEQKKRANELERQHMDAIAPVYAHNIAKALKAQEELKEKAQQKAQQEEAKLQKLQSQAARLANNISDKFKPTPSDPLSTASKEREAIKEAKQEKLAAANATAKAYYDEVNYGITPKAAKVQPKKRTLFEQIVRNIVSNMFNSILNKFNNIYNSITKGVKNLFGIKDKPQHVITPVFANSPASLTKSDDYECYDQKSKSSQSFIRSEGQMRQSELFVASKKTEEVELEDIGQTAVVSEKVATVKPIAQLSDAQKLQKIGVFNYEKDQFSNSQSDKIFDNNEEQQPTVSVKI